MRRDCRDPKIGSHNQGFFLDQGSSFRFARHRGPYLGIPTIRTMLYSGFERAPLPTKKSHIGGAQNVPNQRWSSGQEFLMYK